MHFLDIFRFSAKSSNLIKSTFEECGPKAVIEDIRLFCSVDKKRCTWPIILTNAWWRTVVIFVQSFRILVNFIHLGWYAHKRSSMSNASELTTSRLYDIGDDMGSISRFILDFRTDEEFEQSEWD
jgi:hypothetical protein